ncbi:hypothetical protein [Paraurantiacibacter namhicola]|uniref:Lipoprotein n=1 Tax=Paraurantiacibacter namhicola TaxID=645517 RepID=A0A1C7D9U5_9SPHN|nr:hypothetical protein [Paraurantiacibacter namhicola]ANU08269.1 hypothetical protein A6F65_01979 [Paraurantiacibacter namhicola]
MTKTLNRMRNACLVVAASLLLTGCLFSPGKFGSQLALYKDGSFTYTYDGEIVFFMLTDFAKDLDGEAAAEFTPSCFDEETYEDRDCTEEEIAQQREEWDAQAEARAEREAKEMAEMQAMFGFDPSDPEAGNQIASRLERQAGWDSVTYRGEGIFDVRYSISGTLSHDFAFPTVEGMPSVTPFLATYRRDGGKVRIDAPAFTGGEGGAGSNGMSPNMGLLGMAMMGSGGDKMPQFANIEGTFAIVTDGEILANNTDEGPEDLGNGTRRLTWSIDAKTAASPTALIGF